jgi:hypothetical protein
MINTRSSVRVRRSMTFPRGRVRSSLKKKKTKYNKNVPKRSRSRKATFKRNDDPRSVIDNNNFNKDSNNENEERINTMDSATTTDSIGVSVSDEDDDNHDHDHNDEYYYDNVDSSEEYDWTNKITAIASSSGNLMEDLEDIIRGANNGQDGDDCDSDWEEESTTGSITTATVIEVDLLDMNMDIIGDDGDKFNNLNDIFNHPEFYQQNEYTTMEEGKQEQDDDHKNHEEDHDVDLLDGSSFVVFGNDYPGSSNTCCNNNDDDDGGGGGINNKQTMKISDGVDNNVVRKHSHSPHPAIPVHVGPKTSRINPMIGERSFTDDIKQDEITTILSNNAPVRRREYRKRKPKEVKGTTRSHSYSLRRSIIASKEEEEERRKTAGEDNNISAASPPPISFDNDESGSSISSSSSPSATPPTCTTTIKSTRKRELQNLASYNKVPSQEKKKRLKPTELKNLTSYNKVPNQEKKNRSKPIVKANKQDSLLLSSANTTTTSEYELQSSSYSYFTHGGNHHRHISNENVLPRRIAKKFLYRPANNNFNSGEGESCAGNVRSKPFFGTVIVKGLQEKKNDNDGNGRRMSNNTNNKTVVWYVVYDDGDEDIFDEIEYQNAIDQYERLKRWDTNGTGIITSIQHAWG